MREFRGHHFKGAVLRCIIRHNHLGVKAFAGRNEPRQEAPEVLPGVEIQYDDCGLHALKETSLKARVGMSLERQGRASFAVATRLFQREMKSPVMSISLTG